MNQINEISDDDILSYNFFENDEADIRCKKKKIVTVRKDRVCFLSLNSFSKDSEHVIKVGERALYESALVDRSFWGSYYMCLPGVRKEIKYFQTGEE